MGKPITYNVIISETGEKTIINYNSLLKLRKQNNAKFKKTDKKYIKSTSGKNIFEKLQENNVLILIEEKKIIKEKNKSRLECRLTTLQNAALKDYINKYYEIKQPKFTMYDENKKIEIWGCKDGKSCFSNEKASITRGDHIFGIREGVKDYNIIGSDSYWNMIPCTHAENVSWKKCESIKKNLVYNFDNITKEDFEKLSDNEKDKYNKLKKWKEYCKERGAKLYWENGKKIDKDIQEIIIKNLSKLMEEVNLLEEISQIIN